jgi:SIR2-like protein
VLAATDYRRANEGKLARVLERLADGGHLCWIGFSFADQRLATILRQVPLLSGTRDEPGAAPAHVAVMAWDPALEANDPGILAERAEIAYSAQVILYPTLEGDHSALAALLEELADARFPAAVTVRARPAAAAAVPGVGATGGRGRCGGALGAAAQSSGEAAGQAGQGRRAGRQGLRAVPADPHAPQPACPG